MTTPRYFRLWRQLSRTQISLGLVTVLLMIAIGILVLGVYIDIITTNTAFQAGYIITDLSDIERAILLLGNQNQRSLQVSPPDFEALELQRALLGSQMRLALSEAADNRSVTAGLQAMQSLLDQYDRQLAMLRADPTPEQVAAARPALDELLFRLERQSKTLFSQEENTFFSEIEVALRSQHTTQRLLLILSGLWLVFGTLLVLSLWRTVSREFANAYQRLRVEVAERRQAEVGLRQSDGALRAANQNLQTLNARLQNELTLARKIQQGLLPPPRPNWLGLDVVCRCIPAREVGGDFYAYHIRNERCFTLAVGDVSGKGVSAALLMATSLAHFDSTFALAISPSDLLVQLDRALTQYTEATHQNCALCYVEIDDQTLYVANAGCIPPYIRRASGGVEELEVGGLPLGLGIGTQIGYPALEVKLFPHDLVVLTSDGVAEANITPNNLFGFERLKQAIAAGPATSAQAMLDHLQAEVMAFIGNADLHDDLTIVVMQVQP